MESLNSPKEEVRQIFEWLKGQLRLYQELGLEPPPLSAKTAQCLTTCRDGVAVERQLANETLDLERLRSLIGECKRCPLHKGRKNLVFGEGNPRARLVFVGEAPGREEDLIGKPFVGEAGRLLTKIIENGMGLKRNDVYICNVIKCHPPQNRDPEPKEVAACLPFLKKQLEIIAPEVICILGRIAAQALLGKDFKITQDRGKWFEFEGIPVMPTFHPAYLLRNPKAKRPVWEDVKQVMNKLGLKVKSNG